MTTRNIWRRSARAIRRMALGRATNGTPPIDPISEPTSGIEKQLAEVLKSHWHRDRMETAEFVFWDTAASIKHWFGRHTMIPSEIWDMDNGTVRVSDMVCWKCPYRAPW